MNKCKVALSSFFAVFAVVVMAADFDKAVEWANWQKFAKSYDGDYSDSSEYLLPPKEGRLAKPVRLCENGNALAEIVVDLSDAINIENYYPDPAKRPLALRWQMGYEAECARNAAFELKKLLKLVTDTDFPVVVSPSGEKKTRIFLGAPFAAKFFPEDIKALASAPTFDGYAIREKDGDIYIFGVTPPGTLYGAIRFVENNTDLIFAAPAGAGLIYTKSPVLDAVWGDARVIPAFRVRGYQGGDREWKMRNGLNYFEKCAENTGFCALHGGHYLCPQYYDYATGLRKWNSMDAKGVRSKSWDEARDHACLSDQDFLPHAIETVPGIGTFMYSMPYATIIGMDDNSAVCHCEKCTSPIKAEDGTMLTPEKDKEDFWCAWFYQYLNKVDDEIQKRSPGYTTSTFAYFFAKTYPKIKVNPTIVPVLCTYWRGNYHHPVFAPGLEIWQRCYEGWAAHTGDLFLYDYYGLAVNGHPYAEVYQRELKYQQSLGFLSTSTEGFMDGDNLGTIDDRWCMARLAWNPDADVEQLHRYFTQRAYREAAPYMHHIRGMVRKAYFAADSDKLKDVVVNAGLVQPIMDDLDKAKAAVKHPGAARLVDRAADAWGDFLGVNRKTADDRAFQRILSVKDNKWVKRVTADGDPCFEFDMKGGKAGDVGLPADIFKGKLAIADLRAKPGYFETCGSPMPVVAQTANGKFDECECSAKPAGENRLEVTFRVPEGISPAVLSFVPDRPRSGWTPPEKTVALVGIKVVPDDGRLLGEVANYPKPAPATLLNWKKHYAVKKDVPVDFDDRMQPLGKRREVLIAKIAEDIENGKFKTSADALAFFKEHVADNPARTYGYSVYMNHDGGNAIKRIADAFAKQNLFNEAAAVYDAWVTWDGDKTPFDIQWNRIRAKHAFFAAIKTASAKDVKSAVEDEYMSMLKRAMTESSRAAERSGARLTLAKKLDVGSEAYRNEVLAVLNDEYAPNTIRAEAAKLIVTAFTANGKTDWTGAENALHAALASSDWSNLTRGCYSRQSTRDLQLDALLALVQAESSAGQTDKAKAFLEKGAKTLGYGRKPAETLDIESRTVPHTFTRPTLSEITERYSALQRVRNTFDAIAPSVDLPEEDILSLDE